MASCCYRFNIEHLIFQALFLTFLALQDALEVMGVTAESLTQLTVKEVIRSDSCDVSPVAMF